MNKIIRVFFVVVCIVTVVLFSVAFYPQINKFYQDWQGRRLIYPASSTVTEFPDSGRGLETAPEQLFVVPKGVGRPVWAKVADKGNYSEQDNNIYIIPAQEQLLYAVGVFQKWEDIPGTLDKYIIIEYPKTKEIEKFRVSFEPSDLFKENPTKLSVEDVTVRSNTDVTNFIEKPSIFSLSELTYNIVSELIKKGDVVILESVFDPPYLSKRDEGRNYLVSWLIVRRVGGKVTLDNEISNLLNKK